MAITKNLLNIGKASITGESLLNGATFQAPLKWIDSTALPEQSSPQYFVCIDAFASGGTTKWASVANVKTALGVPTLTNHAKLADATAANKYMVSTGSGTYSWTDIPTTPANNVTGSGTSGYLTKWNGTNTITNGPQLGSDTTLFLSNAGTWLAPAGTTYSVFGASGSTHSTGLVPDPGSTAGTAKFLREDASWQIIPDEKVKQSASSTNATFSLLACENSNPGAGITGEAIYSSAIKINPNKYSLRIGTDAVATGQGSYALGDSVKAIGKYSHVEGYTSKAVGDYSHAEGYSSNALGFSSHSEGYGLAYGLGSHAEGNSDIDLIIGTWDWAANSTTISCNSEDPGDLTYPSVGIVVCFELTENNWIYRKVTSIGSDYFTVDEPFSTSAWTGATLGIVNSGMAYGINSHTEGDSLASGKFAHSEGGGTVAFGLQSHSEGHRSYAIGAGSHAEGGYYYKDEYGYEQESNGGKATGAASHAEGLVTLASGIASHSEGSNTSASGDFSHAEGEYTGAVGKSSHVEGYQAKATGDFSHAEGGDVPAIRLSGKTISVRKLTANEITALSNIYEKTYTFVDVSNNIPSLFPWGKNSISIYQSISLTSTQLSSIYEARYVPTLGYTVFNANPESGLTTSTSSTTNYWIETIVLIPSLHVIATGRCSHAEGLATIASGSNSHAEGCTTTASGSNSHAEGINTVASGSNSHAEGINTVASGDYSHAEGTSITASGASSHAEGDNSTASAFTAHAEGDHSVARGRASHGEGRSANAVGYASHSEGYDTDAFGDYSHAEGYNCKAGVSGSPTIYVSSHAEGYNTTASGNSSHAEGINTVASGDYSHASGNGTTADKLQMTAIGAYNAAGVNGELFAIGNGKSSSNKKTSFKVVDDNGTIFGGNVTVTVTGKVNASNGFFQTSDINKKNILGELDLDKAYDLIDKCQEILYTLKDDKENKQLIGMLAQEVKEFFPEIISENNGELSLDYSRLTVVILRVLKDLINRIKKLEEKNYETTSN